MREEELPVYFKNALRNLRQSSGTIDYDINDALDNATSVEDFQERVSQAMNSLIGEAESVKKMISGDKERRSAVPGALTIDDARQVAFETLRYVATLPGWENFKDLVGRELDITDEIIDQAVDLLFSEDDSRSKKTECTVNISEDEGIQRFVDRYYVTEEEIDMELAKLRNYGKECNCGRDVRVAFKQILEGDFDEIIVTCLQCGGTIE